MLIKTDIFKANLIQMLQTTRVGGYSDKPYDSLNLGVFGKDPKVIENIEFLTHKNSLPHSPVFMQQIHTDNIIEYTNAPQKHGQFQADACFTYQKNIICAVLTADCLPVLIADKDATVVAAIHCGWKGLFSEILPKTITKMQVNPLNYNAGLGHVFHINLMKSVMIFAKILSLKIKNTPIVSIWMPKTSGMRI